MSLRSASLLLAMFILFILPGAVRGADPFVGTWKLNLAESKYDPGPAPKSATVKIEASEGGISYTSEGVDAEGNPTHVEFSAKYDGEDYPVTGSPLAETVAIKRIDSHTLEVTGKRGEEVVVTSKSVVSKDGKVWTATSTGTDPKSRRFNNTVVYDKQ